MTKVTLRRTLLENGMATIERTPESAQAMQQVLSYLMWERQQLRAHGANGAELEANEKAIVAMQWHLDQVLAGIAQADSS